MATYRKAILALLVGVAPVAGCATYDYGYDNPYGYDRYYDGPGYYYPGYVGPSVGLGYSYYYDRDGRRYYHRDRDRDRDRPGRHTDGQREWRDRDNDSRPDPVVPDGINRGGDLGTGRDPRANPNNSPG